MGDATAAGIVPFYNGKEPSKHANRASYAENQIDGWDDATGYGVQ